MQETFLNPANHVPFLEEMRHAYARRNGSILDKVSELPATSLMEFMIGESACKRLQGSNLIKEIYDKVQKIKEKNKLLDANIIASRCFPKFVMLEEMVVENYALGEPALSSFMCGVLNYVVPKELLSTQKRVELIKFIVSHLLSWRAGTRLLRENESYPLIDYAVIEKEVKLNLMKLWAVCDNDKYLTQAVLDGISMNLTHFLSLYVLHSLRSQTKIGLSDDGVASFYYLPTYNEIKRHIPMKAKAGKTRSFSICSGEDSESMADLPPIKSEGFTKHHGSNASNREGKSAFSATSTPTGTIEARGVWKSGDDNFTGSASSSNCNSEAVSPSVKRIKVENGHDWSKLKFPRDRPPDDIPVYDYTKVKREKLDPKFAQMETECQISNDSYVFQMETESQISNDSSSSNAPAADEWEDVLKSVNADQTIPEGYKMAFRCLVMSNRDLREHNRILRAQLEKG
ncbi:hypothetical protein GCK32_007796 [Trichostrongylus colubriformis]|uniref:Uncharacterized protein n=1 Tax=Trichostrongylus colubriformis TaxID=6319 RepID=A0AAN8IF48_TRICO